MNDLGLLLVGGTARVTALAAVGVALALILRRLGPAAGVLVAVTTLSGLVAVSASSLSPWPRFWSIDVSATPRAPQAAELAAGPRPDPTAVPAPPTPTQPSDTRLVDFAREFVREF